MAQNTGDDGRVWAEALVRQVGNTAKELRGKRSARWLSDRTAELGHRIPATVIAKLDSGHRGAVLSLPELLVLAAALGAPPLALLLPADPTTDIEAMPGRAMSSGDFVGWFIGDATPHWGDIDPAASQNLVLVRQLNELNQQIAMLRHSLLLAEHPLQDVEAVPGWRERMEADAEHYREMLSNAERNRAGLLKALSGDESDGSL